MAAHSISNAFYILRKDYSVKERKEMLLGLCYMYVCPFAFGI